MEEALYGTWRSPITSELVATAGLGLGRFEQPEPVEDGVYWLEARPTEGRTVLVFKRWDSEPVDAVPEGFNVRTSVHEYGGGAYFRGNGALFCINFEDQRLYRLDALGAEPRPLTPEPPAPRSLRYADGAVSPDSATIVCVRERHESDGVVNELIALSAEGPSDGRVVATGRDFFSFPRFSPDGQQLAWTSWDHPRLPFIGTDLWVAEWHDGTVGEPRHVAGGEAESIFQPAWSPEGILYFVSDRSGWWNLYREQDGAVEAVAPVEAELGWMQWVFAMSSYGFLPDGRIACLVNRGNRQPLTLLDPRSGHYDEVETGYSVARSPALRVHGSSIVWVAESSTEPISVLRHDVETGRTDVIARGLADSLDPAYMSAAEPIEFPSSDGRAYAFFYAPRNPEFRAPRGERPPLVVSVHGGPTSQVVPGVSLGIQFMTSRGFAVVDVNYGGSTGYGRAYAERLHERWGPVDTDDCIAAARYLVDRGDVDRDRVAITGGSAGGYTTLYALAFEDFFAAGASFFGVSDLLAFDETTHKFESRYNSWLLGPLPRAQEVYERRSPARHADELRAPVLLLQGLEDKVVPPSQAEIMVEALRRNGVPFAYVAFEGEGHGFRRAENVRRAQESMISFFAQVFGIGPVEGIEPIEIENL